MRIAVPLLGFGRAGGYRVLSELATAWTRAGHQVRLLTHASGPLPYFPTLGDVCWLDDAGRSVCHTESAAPQEGGPGFVLRNLRAIWRGIEQNAADCDLIVANHSLTAWPVAAARVGARKGYYVQAYEPDYYALRGGARSRVLQLASAASYSLPLIRVVNAPIYLSYKRLRAAVWVPPGIDFDVFWPREGRPPWERRSIVIGCVGRPEPDKGTRYVLEAFELLRSAALSFTLRLAYGTDGREPPTGAEVVIPKNDRELADYYRSVDVLIAPGISQLGAPHYPVMEAMACGTPVITTGFLPATPENACIVQPKDPHKIAEAVLALAGAPEIRERRVQRALEAIASFTWPTVASRLLAALTEVPA